MAIRIEVNEDGTLHYISDGPVVLTGPATGEVQLANGKRVNVNPAVIEAQDDDEAAEIADAVARKFVAEGHPTFLADPTMPDDGFEYITGETVTEE